MKRFNVSILAIIAVLAVGLTAFTKAESKAKRAVISNCYTSVTLACEQDGITLTGKACNTLPQYVGDAVKSVSGLGSIDCGVTQNVFCCAQLEIDPLECPTQPVLNFRPFDATSNISDFAQIHAVFCKP